MKKKIVCIHKPYLEWFHIVQLDIVIWKVSSIQRLAMMSRGQWVPYTCIIYMYIYISWFLWAFHQQEDYVMQLCVRPAVFGEQRFGVTKFYVYLHIQSYCCYCRNVYELSLSSVVLWVWRTCKNGAYQYLILCCVVYTLLQENVSANCCVLWHRTYMYNCWPQ